MTKQKKEFINVACPVCEKEEFENIDYLKSQTATQKLHLCKTCGNIIYNPQPTPESLTDFYYEKYRKAVTIDNIITCNRKLQYHKGFLGNLIKLKEGEKKSICDVGCANGYFLDYMKKQGWDAKGTEHTKGFVNFAKHHFGLDIKSFITDFDEQFDIISYYHVLEHIQNPHVELAKVRKKLKDNGYLYLAIPYLNTLSEAGGSALRSFDDLVPIPHLNLFTHLGFESMLNKQGFKIIRANTHYYGLTVLAQKCEPTTEIKVRNYHEILDILKSMHAAISIMKTGDWEGAVERFPKFPDAWLNFAAQSKKFKDSMGILDRAQKVMPLNASIYEHIGHTLFRNNKFERAIDVYKYSFALKPGNDGICRHIGLAFGELGDYQNALQWFKKGLEINPGAIAEWYKWIGWAYSKM